MIVALIGMFASVTTVVAPKQVPEVHTEHTVEISWFPKESLANQIATIFYNWGWKDMVTTMIWENWGFNKDIVSITNDHWLCQLHYTWHKTFIDSKDFKDPIKQANYCVGVRKDAVKKHRLKTTFYAYNHRQLYNKRVTVVTKQYYNLFNKRFYLE